MFLRKLSRQVTRLMNSRKMGGRRRTGLRSYSEAAATNLNKPEKAAEEPEMINGVPLPPEPTHCCNSECANCVWIKYAQEVTQMFENGDTIARNKIVEKVQDPKLRAFLLTQLGIEAAAKE